MGLERVYVVEVDDAIEIRWVAMGYTEAKPLLRGWWFFVFVIRQDDAPAVFLRGWWWRMRC